MEKDEKNGKIPVINQKNMKNGKLTGSKEEEKKVLW